MKNQGHKPILKGSKYVCSDCGRLLLDITSPAKLRALIDIDQVKLGAVINRISSDANLAERVATEDPREVIATYKLADKLNDFLMNPKARPDLQTPEAQHFLQILKHYHSPKTDPMMPWLAREWKKGRIRPSHGGRLEFDGGPDYEHEDAQGNASSWHNLTESGLDHWADWYGSDHPSRQGQDIMQMKSPDMHQTVEDWNRDMRSKAGEAAQVRGDVEYAYPDGWTVQKLTTPQQLSDEGDAMGHCVGSYAPSVQRGESLIYSLRDHHNEPHATWEVIPRWHEGEDGKLYSNPDGTDETDQHYFQTTPSPKGGTMEQIQGKGNEPPISAYQKRIKDYFDATMPNTQDRPKWEDQHIGDLDELMDHSNGYIAYHPGEYGLETPKTTFDWPEIMRRHIGFTEYEPDEIVQKALYHKQFPQMCKAAEEDIAQRESDRSAELEEEWGRYNQEEFTHQYDEHDPRPELENFPGERDNATYNKAYDEWEKRYEEAEQKEMEEYVRQREQQGFAEQEHMHNMQTAIATQQQREREGQTQPITSKLETVRAPHEHFSTGEPCSCTFRKPESFGWRTAKTRSLYHGTVVDHLPSIEAEGLKPSQGAFVQDHYRGQGMSDEAFNELYPPTTLMADKEDLHHAMNAIIHHVGKKLGKKFGDVSRQDVINHGLLLKHPGQEGACVHPPYADPRWNYRPYDEGYKEEDYPGQVEESDYYTHDPIPFHELVPITGPALMRVFDRAGAGYQEPEGRPGTLAWEEHQAAYATDDPMRCPTCGDPLEHGKCQRCDWGGWSNAMGPNDPIADPTKEVKPAIQA